MSIQSKSQTQCFIELDNILWKVPVSDYSFSQDINQEEIVRNDMASDTGRVNRAISVENTGVNAGEWSVTVPMRPTKSTGSGTGRSSITTGHHHPVEEPLWAMMQAGDPVAIKYPSVNLSELPQYRRATWTLDQVDTSLDGNLVSTGWGTDLWFSNDEYHRVDLYIFPKLPNYYQDYARDFDWTLTTSGNTYTEADGGIPLGRVWTIDSARMAQIRDDIDPNKPMFFVYSKQGASTYGGSIHDPQPGKSYFLFSLMLPKDKSLGEFISAYGDITIGATAKNSVSVQGVDSSELASKWSMGMESSQYEELADANMYFVTDKPQVSFPAGTVNSSNTLIATEDKHWASIRWYLHTQDRSTTFGQKGVIHRIVLNSNLYGGREVPGLVGPWKVAGFREYNTNGDPIYDRQYYMYPDKVTRLGVDYTIDKVSGTWNDGTTTFPAPAVKFTVDSGNKGQPIVGYVAVTGSKKYSALPHALIPTRTSRESAGFVAGDILTILQGTLDDNGNALSTDIQFIVDSAGRNEEYIYNTRIYGVLPDQYELFGSGDPEWINDNFYIESTSDRTGDVTSYTPHSASGQDFRRVVTQAINASGVNDANTATLTASNANIRVGAIITTTGSGLDHPVYVAAISGTTLTFSGNVTLDANAVLTFVDYPENAGLAKGEYRWFNDNNKNILIIRETDAQLEGIVSGNDVVKIYKSKSRHSGGSSVIKLNYCLASSASIDFDMDSVAQIQWSGIFGQLQHEADNFTIASTAPSSPKAGDIFYDVDDDTVSIRDENNTAWRDCITEGTDSSSNFIRNKLTTVGLDSYLLNGPLGTITAYPFRTDGDAVSGFSNGRLLPGLASEADQTYNIVFKELDLSLYAPGLEQAHARAFFSSGDLLLAMYYYADVTVTVDGVDYGSAFRRVNPSVAVFGSDSSALVVTPDNSKPVSISLILTDKNQTRKYNTLAEWNAADVRVTITPKAGFYAPEERTTLISPTSIPVVSGNIKIEQSVQSIYSNLLGRQDLPLAGIVGPRRVSGSLTAYLDSNTSQILSDIESARYSVGTTDIEIGDSALFPNEYSREGESKRPPTTHMVVNLGGAYGDSNTASFIMPACVFTVPAYNFDDAITTTINFKALSTYNTEQYSSSSDSESILGASNELEVQYKGS